MQLCAVRRAALVSASYLWSFVSTYTSLKSYFVAALGFYHPLLTLAGVYVCNVNTSVCIAFYPGVSVCTYNVDTSVCIDYALGTSGYLWYNLDTLHMV